MSLGRSAEFILFNNILLKLCIYLCVIVHIYNQSYIYIFIVLFLYKIISVQRAESFSLW